MSELVHRDEKLKVYEELLKSIRTDLKRIYSPPYYKGNVQVLPDFKTGTVQAGFTCHDIVQAIDRIFENE